MRQLLTTVSVWWMKKIHGITEQKMYDKIDIVDYSEEDGQVYFKIQNTCYLLDTYEDVKNQMLNDFENEIFMNYHTPANPKFKHTWDDQLNEFKQNNLTKYLKLYIINNVKRWSLQE